MIIIFDKTKKVQIEMDMFLNVFNLVERLKNYSLDFTTTEMLKRLETQINAKFEAMEKRELYTVYKTSVNEQEKESVRQKYLDKANIHKDFRNSKDFNNNLPLE